MYEYRGELKNRGGVVDIVKFDKRTAICGDGHKRDIDEFNTIYFGAQKFKSDILKIVDETAIEEVVTKQAKKNY
jgi:hypothetical protein